MDIPTQKFVCISAHISGKFITEIYDRQAEK